MPGFGVFKEGDPIFTVAEPLNLVGLAVADVRLGLAGSRVRLPFRFNPSRNETCVENGTL
jgi:hypothetical protein